MDQTAYFEQMRQNRRNEILNKTRELILNDSLASFTMQGLAKALDASSVTLYKYYKNSEDVINDLYKETLLKIQNLPELYLDNENAKESMINCISLCLDDLIEKLIDIRLSIILGSYTYKDINDLSIISFTFLKDYLNKKLIPLLNKAKKEKLLNNDMSTNNISSYICEVCISFILQAALQVDTIDNKSINKIKDLKKSIINWLSLTLFK